MTFSAKLFILSAGSLAISLSSIAQEDLLLQDTVVVEGSRGNPMLADIEPDVALDFAEIRAYGAASLEELLADLEPLTQSAGGGAPAILLNGRRVAGFRQIRNYPPEALARVEILPEEVALKFGFRANQKVINFVLRDRFHAISTRTSTGAPTEGGQWLTDIDLSNLRIRDDVRWNFDAEYEGQDGLQESDRDILSESESTAADRSLLPEEHALDLTASVSHFLPGDISATYTGGLDILRRNRDIAQSDLNGVIDRETEEIGAEASFVLDKVYTGWNWSVNGGFTYRDVETDTALDPISGFLERTNSETQTANLEGVLFKQLFELPAGNVVTTVKVGVDHADLDSRSDQNGLITQSSLSRTQSNVQANIDMPLFDKGMENNPLGTLTANANARVDDVSDFGTLSSYGFGLTWKPVSSLQVLASTARNENAPALALLGGPISVTETARVFDFSTRETIENVTRITGGNPDLNAEEQTVHRLNVKWDPFEDPDITFNLTYTETQTDNAILSFPGLTPQIEAAFPTRIIRDDSGQLISLDARAINVEESTSRQIRYGFNWSHRLTPPERPDFTDEERRQLREIFLRRLDEADRVRVQQRIAEREARQASGQNSGPRAGQQGRGRGRGFGGRGGRGGGRVFASVYHTYVLEDSLRIGADTATLDLLDGDAISDLGGTPQHLLEAQLGYSNGPVGAFVRANWKSETEFDDGANGALKFDDLATVNLRVQYNFGNNPRLLLKYPILDSTRVSVGIDNLLDEKQRVTDASGLVPITYQPDLLDPQGRVVTLRFRKLFF